MIGVPHMVHSHSSGNLTNAEFYRLHGWLPAHRIEGLIDLEARVEAGLRASAHVEEARTQYPEEGHLKAVADWAQSNVKPAITRDKLVALLADVEASLLRAGEYGREELDKAADALAEMEG